MIYLRKVKGESSNLYPHLYGYNYQVTLLGWGSRTPEHTELLYLCSKAKSNLNIGGGAKRKDLQARRGWNLLLAG